MISIEIAKNNRPKKVYALLITKKQVIKSFKKYFFPAYYALPKMSESDTQNLYNGTEMCFYTGNSFVLIWVPKEREFKFVWPYIYIYTEVSILD